MPKVTTGLWAAGGTACVRAAACSPEHGHCPPRLWIIRDGCAYLYLQHARHRSL